MLSHGVRFVVPVVVVSLLTGCWWQKDKYSDRMDRGAKTYATKMAMNRVLGEPYAPPGEFSMWIRPPKPAGPVQVPEDRKEVVAWFQGGEPLFELVVMGSTGTESMAQFRMMALAELAAKHSGPPVDSLTPQPNPSEVACMHGGQTTFELFVGANKRPAGDYQWLVYFAEETPQKVMLAFIIPDAKYGDFTDGVDNCLQSLALASKVGIAQGGTPSSSGAAPAGF